jgi:hypothetical protein
MKPIKEYTGKGLKWVQPSAMKMEYELQAGQELTARLRFRSSFGSFATAESADGCWTFKRVGFFQTHVSIRRCGDETDLAVFRNNTWKGGGTLEFPSGFRYLATTNFWQTHLDFQTENGGSLVSFHSGGFIHLSADVEIAPVGALLGELPLLVLLGWYLVIMMHQDSAAVVAASSAAYS